MEFLNNRTLWQLRSMAAVAGALVGYAYYYYIGCVNGTCAITSNPYISTLYGMAIALLLIDKKPNEEKKEPHGNDINTDQNI